MGGTYYHVALKGLKSLFSITISFYHRESNRFRMTDRKVSSYKTNMVMTK